MCSATSSEGSRSPDQNYSAVCTNEGGHGGAVHFDRPAQQATEP